MRLKRKADSPGWYRIFPLRDGSQLPLTLEDVSDFIDDDIARMALEDYAEHLEAVPSDEEGGA